MFRAIGAGIMAVIGGIGAILQGVIGAIVSFFGVLISLPHLRTRWRKEKDTWTAHNKCDIGRKDKTTNMTFKAT